MDTGTHFRAIWRRRWVVLAAALAAGLLVLVLRIAQDETYSAQADIFLVPAPNTSSASNEVERLTIYYGQLVTDPRVVADMSRRAQLPLTVGESKRLVDVSSAEDGQLTVVAEQPTDVRAATLANAAADALAAGAALDQAEAQRRELAPLVDEIEELQAELQELSADSSRRRVLEGRLERAEQARVDALSVSRARLDVVRRAEADDAVSSPRPVRDALLAFVLVGIVGAELAALAAVRRRGVEGGDPVPAVESWSELPVFRVGPSRYGPDESGAALRFLQADEEPRPLYVAPLAPGASTDIGLEHLLDALAALGTRTTWVDLRADHALPPVPRGAEVVRPRRKDLERAAQHRPQPTLVTADAWESPELLRLAELLPGTCVLLVDAARARQPELAEAIEVLGLADLTPQAVLVVEGSRPGGLRAPRLTTLLPSLTRRTTRTGPSGAVAA